MKKKPHILWFKDLGMNDVSKVGGKNASLGEMYRHLTKKGVAVPNGYAVTTSAYFYFLKKAGIQKKMRAILSDLDTHDLKNLQERGRKVRQTILSAKLPKDLEDDIVRAYRKMEKDYGKNVDVAVRSSASAEDLPTASFAGQMETYLNIRGEQALLEACKKGFASLFTDRGISYRAERRFNHLTIGISIAVQKMVRADKACSGVAFSIDTETGFQNAVLINGSWGLGENVVQGKVNPDEFYVFKPTLKKGFRPIINRRLGNKSIKMIYGQGAHGTVKNIQTSQKERTSFVLSEDEILKLAEWVIIIESHYRRPMDVEWAKDGISGELYIVQARPETVQSQRDYSVLEEYRLHKRGRVIATGSPVGKKIASAKANIIPNVSQAKKFKSGEMLVTDMTDPDWEVVMKRAAGIITNKGGRTCFAGDTLLLTHKGFLTIQEIAHSYRRENIQVLSVDRSTLKMEWRKVTDGMVSVSNPISVDISQTGRMKNNVLKLTPDHKVCTFQNRKLISRDIQNVIDRKEYLISAQNIPWSNVRDTEIERMFFRYHPDVAYLLGGIMTDGHVYISKSGKHGEVQFIQKPTDEKRDFIKKMTSCLKNIYGYNFHVCIKKISHGIIRGQPISGTANAYRCYSKSIALECKGLKASIVLALLQADEAFIYNFLAGVIDGDGSYSQKSNRIHIYCSQDNLMRAIVVACMRLHIAFSVSKNRGVYNVQIVDTIDTLFQYTQRVKGQYKRERYGVRFFSAKQLLGDMPYRVNYKGRILPYIYNNLLIDSEKIRTYLVPMIRGEIQNHELTNIINSNLKMLRVNFHKKLQEQKVYNITVEKNHNYFVFTNRYTPILVENCHAAIVSRELGIPCIVGTNDATKKIKMGQSVTLSCAEGETGYVYDGALKYSVKKTSLKKMKKPKTKIMMIMGTPDIAFQSSFIPNSGVGLARLEFIINSYIQIHPLALINFSRIKDARVKKRIEELTVGYKDKSRYFVDTLAEGAAMIAAAFYPHDVIVRLSDFKTNEYANLIGGKEYEPKEENPMLGWRGASRYYSEKFLPAFRLECEALKKVRDVMGLRNVKVMVPFCRTVEEGKKVLKIMAENGLRRGVNGLEVYVMCEIPSNVILADEFAKIFDGFSIGSNDLTQLTLGVDRDSELVSHIYDERNDAVKTLLAEVIKKAKIHKRKVGICGQAPSDFPEIATFLVERGIDSISLNPDTVVKTTLRVLAMEKKLGKGA